jgi:DNA-binding NarL/FixJ family response regulator
MNPAQTRPYRILIADDHTIVRRGFRALIASQPGVEVCCEASTGLETMRQARKEMPDLVVLDLTMPEMNGLDVTRAIREECPETNVLILTIHFSEELARQVFRAGALGYVLKSDAESDLLAAIDHIRHRQPFFTSQLAASMMQSFVQNNKEAVARSEDRLPLTPREIEVVQLLASGNSNKAVADALSVSTRTVESHRNHIMHKMNFGSFSELVRFAVRHNLIEL